MNVLPSFEALQSLARMERRRRRDDGGLDSRLRQTLGEICRPMRDIARFRHVTRRVRASSAKTDHLDAGYLGDRVEMLLSERALANHRNFHHGRNLGASPAQRFSRMMRPAAVLDAGTW